MKYVSLGISLLLFMLSTVLSAQHTQEKKRYTATRITRAPQINGLLDDEAWEEGDWKDEFIQNEPYNGGVASQKTEYKILFDDDNLYVAFKAWDSSPDSIVNRLTRRDQIEGDMVAIALDTYHDLRTAFGFFVSVSGVKMDMIWTQNGSQEDPTWDPIWYTATSRDSRGWYAEMRIPFNQLRFKKNSNEVWGFTMIRQIYRKQEMDVSTHIPADAAGFVHMFDELDGLQEVEPRKQLDITPYVVANTERFQKTDGNPYATGKRNDISTGLDAKIGLTNNLTLDLTINPDFGQVEADPSVVNLTAFETFFEEKRPFFIEGRAITNFNIGLGDGDIGNNNLFYSRRIGRSPHSYPELEDGEYAKVPNNTRILAAAKLTGKTENGLSIGIVESITAEERAKIDLDGEKRYETVEPLTNYFLGRVHKDFNKGNTQIGGMITSVNRHLNGDSSLFFLHRAAYTGGLDFKQQFKDRKYALDVSLFFSQVEGEEEALIRTQRMSSRYFQRPDASHVTLDSTRTKLRGSGGKVVFSKQAEGHLNYMAAVLWNSPGLEVNDMGYLPATDDITQILWAGYRIWEPFSIFNNININVNQWSSWDFGGTHTNTGGNTNMHMTFKNFWNFSYGVNFNLERTSSAFLRGGPSFKTPAGGSIWWGMGTDQRKKLVFRLNGNLAGASQQSSMNRSISLGMTWKPNDAIRISLNPNMSYREADLQYMTRTEFEGEDRYIFGGIEQRTLSASLRLNYNISPNLTLEYWGQPFIATGKYSQLKRITNPLADQWFDRFHTFTDEEISWTNDQWEIDEDANGLVDYTLGGRDFNVKEFLSNMVIRWEYVPGSTLFLVWSQSRSDDSDNGNLDFSNNIKDLFSDKPHHVFLVKFSYRFGLN